MAPRAEDKQEEMKIEVELVLGEKKSKKKLEQQLFLVKKKFQPHTDQLASLWRVRKMAVVLESTTHWREAELQQVQTTLQHTTYG